MVYLPFCNKYVEVFFYFEPLLTADTADTADTAADADADAADAFAHTQQAPDTFFRSGP